MAGERQLNLASAFTIWAACSLVLALYGTSLGYGGRQFAAALFVFMLFFAGEVLLAAERARTALLGVLAARAAWVAPLVPLAGYVIYAAGAGLGGWRFAALAALYALAPAILAGLVRNAAPGRWQDYVAVLAIWLPVELRWMYRLWPAPHELTHTLTILFALNTGLAAFLVVRRLDGIGYSVAWRRGFTANVVLHFVVFGAIAIPLGEAMGFLHYGPPLARLRSLPLDALGILLFTAWPEEFLFRGLIQNLLSRTLKSPLAGWMVASVIFGLSHINNGPFPNWRYVFLATIAGLFYGRVWMKTATIFTSGLVHAAVDITWHALFS